MSAIILDNIYKHYHLYSNDYHRLKEIITGKSTAKVIKALDPVSLKIEKGQVLGVVGNNGAGKSTLLKLISGTASPTGGTLQVNGRIAALLELGAGFHPDLTGHENVYLSAAILGISKARIDELYDEIVDFSGIGDFINQPVKTYSSGMFVRLAFSVATSVEPDILIIDEALSVGDGRFARKSFDRIMKFKESGKTILFCSHAMFHIESICDRAIWIEDGQIKMDGAPATIVTAYNATMKIQHSDVHSMTSEDPLTDEKTKNSLQNSVEQAQEKEQEQEKETEQVTENKTLPDSSEVSLARFLKINVQVDDQSEKKLIAQSGQSTLVIQTEFESDFSIQVPNIGITITDEHGFNISSACTLVDEVQVPRDDNGFSKIELTFSALNLLKGKYYLYAYLMCERCILIYEEAPQLAYFEVRQDSREVGIVRLAHSWKQ